MAKQKERTGKRIGAGRHAVVVDEVRQRLFNKYFDEGYSADDIWKQNPDFISRRTADRPVKDFQTTLDWRRSPPATRERSDGARRWVLEVLRRVVEERPAAYLDEIQRDLRKVYKIRIHSSTICRYLHSPAPRGLRYSLLVLEHPAMNKDYSERKRFLDAMATKVFPVEQLIFVDECHKNECLFASRSLISSAQVYKCSAGTPPHTAMFLPWITDKGCAWYAVCRDTAFVGNASAYMSPFTTIRASPYCLRAMWKGLSFLHAMLRRKQ
jgi:transposase